MSLIKKKVKWSPDSMKVLFDIWQTYALQLRGAKRNFHIYMEMTEKMAKRGSIVSPKELKIKINNLTQIYRNEKKKLVSGASPSEWFYYMDVHKIIGGYECNTHEDVSEDSLEKPDVGLINSEFRNQRKSSSALQEHDEQDQRRSQKSSSLSLPGIPGNFSEVEIIKASSSQQQQNKSQLLVPSSKKVTSKEHIIPQKKKITPMRPYPQNAPCPSRNVNISEHESNSGNHANRVKSKDILSAAYNLLQKETNQNQHEIVDNNLKSFGEFIDAELEKLDETSIAIVKMKINEILHEAASGKYKNDAIGKNRNENECLDAANDTETERERLTSRKRPRENSPENNKENQTPSSNLQQFDTKPDNDNRLDPLQTNVFRKKRLKSKQLLSAVYDVLNKEIGHAEPHISFGAYVCSELKMMDDETVKNVKLNICRILYEASIGKCKNSSDQSANEQEEELLEVIEEGHDQKSTDNDIVLVTPKTEFVDSTYDM